MEFGVGANKDVKFFMQNDYIGPLYLFASNDTNTVNELKNDTLANKPPYRVKNFHQWNSYVQKFAKDPLILSFIKPVLGSNVILWGASLINQRGSLSHPWHIDVEHSHNITGVTVWICLETRSDIPKLQLISHSAGIQYSPQEVRSRYPTEKYIRSNSTLMEEISQEFSEKSKLITITPRVGEMVVWKGKVWHHTKNHSPWNRTSIIFQYCGDFGNVDDIPKVPATFDYPNTLWHSTQHLRHYPLPIRIN